MYTQGRIGSCSANAVAAAFEFLTIKEGREPDFMPSRLFIYYNTRSNAVPPTIEYDSGAYLRDTIKTVKLNGTCSETTWPYDDTPVGADHKWPAGSPASTKPSDDCYDSGRTNVVIKYQSLNQTVEQLRGCLASGYPFVFGFHLQNDELDSDNIRQMPQRGQLLQPLGHVVLAVGYDDDRKLFLIRDSFGPNYGDSGYLWMPYDYLTNRGLAWDFWTITQNT